MSLRGRLVLHEGGAVLARGCPYCTRLRPPWSTPDCRPVAPHPRAVRPKTRPGDVPGVRAGGTRAAGQPGHTDPAVTLAYCVTPERRGWARGRGARAGPEPDQRPNHHSLPGHLPMRALSLGVSASVVVPVAHVGSPRTDPAEVAASQGLNKGLGPRSGFPDRGPKPREIPPATRGPMHPRRRFLLRWNDDARLPMTRHRLRNAIRHWAPQPSGPLPSSGTYYVTPSPCEENGQSPGKNLGNTWRDRLAEPRLFSGGGGAHHRSEITRGHAGRDRRGDVREGRSERRMRWQPHEAHQ